MREQTYEGLELRDVARWLHDAKDFRDELAPEGVIVRSNSHSTAIHVYVYLTLKGEEPLLVWYKTNWVSHCYEFNEEGKTIGLQPGCDFIRPDLNAFFIAVRDRLKANRDARIQAEQDAERRKEAERQQKVARFRAAYGSPQ